MRTSELTGAALDWAVAKCEGIGIGPRGFVVYYHEGEPAMWQPSTDWAQGGPILQRHISELIDCGESGWEACCNGTYGATGKTALEAVCKAYVASKLGDDVDVPEELQ